ncbi:hypothetical protein QJQ45_001827 [Haematococcus lacustris]|nr:hypothetical protein QJQ45_001827 [Haematococcus lacustris]
MRGASPSGAPPAGGLRLITGPSVLGSRRAVATCARGQQLTTALSPSVSTHELHVCTGQVCKRQGSKQVLKLLQDLHLQPAVAVVECGCLGGCGSGPNIMLLPEEQRLSHVSTPSDAMQLRLAGNSAAQEGDLDSAIQLYCQALELRPPHGAHLILCNRAAAHLQKGRKQEALQDAQAAVDLAPPDFVNGWVRLIDCQYACGDTQAAISTLSRALKACPNFAGIREYKAIVQALGAVSRASINMSVTHPDVAIAVAVPCGIFMATILTSVAWMAVMGLQAVKDKKLAKEEKEAKEAALKARL